MIPDLDSSLKMHGSGGGWRQHVCCVKEVARLPLPGLGGLFFCCRLDYVFVGGCGRQHVCCVREVARLPLPGLEGFILLLQIRSFVFVVLY